MAKERKQQLEQQPLTDYLIPGHLHDYDAMMSIGDVREFIEVNEVPFVSDNLFSYMQKNYSKINTGSVYLYFIKYEC